MSRLKRRARLLCTYFSHTGNTKRAMETLCAVLRRSSDVEIVEIMPKRKRSYMHWLAYSFIPGSNVEIENQIMEVSDYDGVVLGFPKWTFSCPPLNRFIGKLTGVQVPRFFLLMTSGGFDEKRFMRRFTQELREIGCNIVDSLTIKRKWIHEGTYMASVESFSKRIEEELKLR